MNLLSPFFLAGLVLIAGPIIAHLIRRATKDRIEFSAIRFLAPSKPRLDRRSRVQHPLLLLLRCLIVAVLALAFTRPYWTQTAPPVTSATQPRIVVALLDRSASMRTGERWDEAKSRVESLVAVLAPLLYPESPWRLVGRPFLPPFGEKFPPAPSAGAGSVSDTLRPRRGELTSAGKRFIEIPTHGSRAIMCATGSCADTILYAGVSNGVSQSRVRTVGKCA